MVPQEVAALKDIQVNFLKSPDIRTDMTTAAMNTVVAHDQANISKKFEDEARIEFHKVSNFVVSPKQEKPFTALPVIVSTKTRNTNEVTQTNQRDYPRALAECPNINGKGNQKVTELHDPFTLHRPSLT